MKSRQSSSLDVEHLYGQPLYPAAPLSWLAPLWSFICGVIASANWTWTGSSVLRLFLGLLLAGPLLGTVWGAMMRVRQHIKVLCNLSGNTESNPILTLPYTLSGSTSYRLGVRLSLLSQWWQEAESVVSRPLVQLAASTIFSLTVAAELGRPSLIFAALGIIFAYTMGFSRGRWVFHPVFSISVPLFLNWLLGHVAFAALQPISVVMAASFAFVFCGCFLSNRTGQSVAWQLVPQVVVVVGLVASGQPVIAAIVTLLASSQLLLIQLLWRPERRKQYFQAIQWQLAGSMLLAALALGYKP
nr:hypothetical protein [Chloroflexota bacterium]